MEELRVGLVGGGPWARLVHGPGVVAHPRTALTGVWTRRPEVATELATEFGSRAYTDLDELFDAVDIVAFAVPPQVQGGLVVRAAAAGRHLICEKPLAGSGEDARAAAEAIERAGVASSMVMTLRHDERVRAWLAGLPTGPAGPDTTGSARWLSGSLLGGPFSASGWRQEHGALLDLGPHVIDLLDTALGPVTTVDWAHYDEPDLWRFGLTHEGGARSTSLLSMRMPVDPSEIEFAVFGGGGVHKMSGGADATTAFAHLLDELVAAIDGIGPGPALDAARGLRLQTLVEEVRRAAT